MVSLKDYVETFPMNTTTAATEPMKSVSPSVGPEAQLMLLQLLTQVKFLQKICKPNNETSPGEEALRTLARDAIEREQDTKRQLETLERTSEETVTNLTAELNGTIQQLNVAQELNKNLSVSLKKKEEEMQELQRKMEGLENRRAKQLQDVLKGQSKEKALIKAAKRGNTEEMSIILDDSTVDLEYSDPVMEWTALEWAVAFGHTQVCKLLLERGANAKKAHVHGTFESKLHWPLRVAARFGHLEIASLLLQYGADIPNGSNIGYDEYGDQLYRDKPEQIANARGFWKLAQMLCEWKDDNNCHYLKNRYDD